MFCSILACEKCWHCPSLSWITSSVTWCLSVLFPFQPSDITIVKSMKNPPLGVKIVMAAVCVMKDIKPEKINDPSGSGQKVWLFKIDYDMCIFGHKSRKLTDFDSDMKFDFEYELHNVLIFNMNYIMYFFVKGFAKVINYFCDAHRCLSMNLYFLS